MKTKDFIRKVEEMGFDAEERGNEVYLYGRVSNCYAKISKKFKYTINTSYHDFIFLNEGDRGLLFDLIVEYISTPVNEREEEKKFYLKHRWLENWEDYNYLNFEISGFYYSLNSKLEDSWVKTKFTLKEIEEIKKKFDTDLADFELVEVEDEN